MDSDSKLLHADTARVLSDTGAKIMFRRAMQEINRKIKAATEDGLKETEVRSFINQGNIDTVIKELKSLGYRTVKLYGSDVRITWK